MTKKTAFIFSTFQNPVGKKKTNPKTLGVQVILVLLPLVYFAEQTMFKGEKPSTHLIGLLVF
jgi:hypothetical protein